MPRLGKGEAAVGIRMRSQASSASAEARIALMLVLRGRGVISELEAAPFTSFDALCKHVDESNGIFPISPKTLRKHIAKSFVGGVEAFRQMLKWFSSNGKLASIDVMPGPTPRVASASFQTDAVLEMSARYADLIERVAKLAMESPRARIEFQAHLRVFPESAGHLKRVK